MKTLIWSKLGFKKGWGSRGSCNPCQCLLCALMGTSDHFIHHRSALEPANEAFRAWIPAMDFCSIRGSREGACQPSGFSTACVTFG